MKTSSKTSTKSKQRLTAAKAAVIAKAAKALTGKQHLPPDEPEYGTPDDETPEMTPEQFAQAIALRDRRMNPPSKQRITIMLDEDILDFFKKQGDGYQTRINETLLRYMMRIKSGSGVLTPDDVVKRLRMELDQLEHVLKQGA